MKHFTKPVNIDPVGTRQDQALDEAEDILSAPGTGEWFLVPYKSASVVVSIDCTAGTGYIQTTNDLYDKIVDNTALAQNWPWGTAAITREEVCEGAKAIRLVCVSGTVRMTLLSRVL